MFNLSGLKTLTGCVTNKAVLFGQPFFIFGLDLFRLPLCDGDSPEQSRM